MAKYKMKKRINFILIVFFCFFALLTYRMKIISFDYSGKYTLEATNQYSYSENLTDINYSIFDTKGRDLLKYKDKFYAVIVPDTYRIYNSDTDKAMLLSLQYILHNYNIDYNIDSNINSRNYISNGKLYYPIDELTYNKLEDIKGVKGFYIFSRKEVNRDYSWQLETILSSKGTGGASVDTLQNEISDVVKNNTTPAIMFIKNSDNTLQTGKVNVNKNNVNLRLTINSDIEGKIKSIIQQDKYNIYPQIGVVMMEANTGKIMALTQKDEKEPNVNLGSATINGFYPGSIFKTIVEEAGLEAGKITTDSKFTCVNNKDSLCQETHGTLTVSEAYIESCNNIFSQIGNIVGYKNYINLAKSEGLFNKVLNIDSEVKGTYVEPVASAGGSRLLSIGQNMLITPLQSIGIVNAVINDGVYVKPYLIDAYVDNSNNILKEGSTTSNRVISEATASIMKKAMLDVTKYGTGYAANSSTYSIGGKTGTTSRLEENKNHSDGWFIGFFKLQDKYYSMVVFVKDIDPTKDSGGTTAAPIFKEIVENISTIK